jgi:hypothetical protein
MVAVHPCTSHAINRYRRGGPWDSITTREFDLRLTSRYTRVDYGWLSSKTWPIHTLDTDVKRTVALEGSHRLKGYAASRDGPGFPRGVAH